MSEREEYTPTMDDLVDGYAYCTGIGPVIGERRRAIAKRAIAAHDQALREQIAEEIEARRNEPGQIEMADRFGGYHAGQSAGFDLAARIARGEVTR